VQYAAAETHRYDLSSGKQGLPGLDSSPRDFIVAVNGNASRSREGDRLLAEVSGHLRRQGARVSGQVTGSESDLRRILESADGRRVVLVGGDGTLHTAVNLGVPLPELAVVPTGRANNVARALGIPAGLAEATRVAATAPAHPLDLLRVKTNGSCRYCVEAVSGGLQAEARAAYDGENSGDLGAGARAFAGALRRYRPYEVELRVDGRPAYRGRAAQVFLSNLPFFGFGFPVDPVARVADGMLEAIVLPADSRAAALRMLLTVYRGRHLDAAQGARRAHRAELETPLPLTCDGTPLGVGSASVRVEPSKLSVASPWRR
jgi:diacylglycerol kinase family enzyme